jgi:phosphomannomutase
MGIFYKNLNKPVLDFFTISLKPSNTMKYKHLFFDLDMTIAPSLQPMLPPMYELLSSLTEDIVVVSGQLCEKIKWQTTDLKAHYLCQNGNHALDPDGNLLWNTPLNQFERMEIMAHIDVLMKHLPEKPNPKYDPVEDRGAQITFSPVGNTAPVELKRAYDPDASKRLTMLKNYPFESETIMAVIGGSTSIDYIPKTRHKGTNVKKLIKQLQWNANECVYFGDGLYPGGNDEFVIGVIDTLPVTDEIDCYEQLKEMFR